MPQGAGRVVVGVSGSLASMAALRQGMREAARDGRSVEAVLSWKPPDGGLGHRLPPTPLAELLEHRATARLKTVFDQALGGIPAYPPVTLLVVRSSSAGRALCALAGRPNDLLVIGTSALGTLGRFRRTPVRGHVLANADCPVLTVSAPAVPRGAIRALRRAVPADFARSGVIGTR